MELVIKQSIMYLTIGMNFFSIFLEQVKATIPGLIEKFMQILE